MTTITHKKWIYLLGAAVLCTGIVWAGLSIRKGYNKDTTSESFTKAAPVEISSKGDEIKKAQNKPELGVIEKNTDPNLSVTLENGTVLKKDAVIDGLRIASLYRPTESQPLSSRNYAVTFIGPVETTGQMEKTSEGAILLRLEKPIFTGLTKGGYTDFSLYYDWQEEKLEKMFGINKKFPFLIGGGVLDGNRGTLYVTDGPETKTFHEGSTTMRIEEIGDPIFSNYSLPFLPRITFGNTWGTHVFQPVHDWVRGKPSNIRISPTGRFISFEIPYGDGFSLPVVVDMKTGENVLKPFSNTEQIMFVPEVVWTSDEHGFVFTSTWSSYGGDGVDGVFYWRDSSPLKLTTLVRIEPKSSASSRLYENIQIHDGTVTVNEKNTDDESIQIKKFPLPQ